MSPLEQQICGMMAKHFPDRSVGLGTRLVEDLGADSLDRLELGQAVSAQFGLPEISDAELAQFETPGRVAAYVAARRLQLGVAETLEKIPPITDWAAGLAEKLSPNLPSQNQPRIHAKNEH